MSNFLVNTTPISSAEHIHNLLALIAANGGTDPSYGDGTSVTAGVAPTAALAVGLAWGMITTASGHQWCFQRHSSVDTYWRITMSVSAAMTGGTPTQAPGSADRIILWGGGSEASPSFTNLLPNASTYRAQYYVGDVAPYGFYAMTYPVGGGDINSTVFQDPVITPALDADPFVYSVKASGSVFRIGNAISQDNSVAFYLAKGLPAEVAVSGTAMYMVNANGSMHTGSSPLNEKYDTYAMGYNRPARYGGTVGFKGWSRLFQWSFTQGLSTPGDGVNAGTSPLAQWTIDDATAKWDGASEPLK